MLDNKKHLCPLRIRDKGVIYLCGTTLVPSCDGTQMRDIGRNTGAAYTPIWASVRCFEGI